jgi:hypothetical protein
MRINRPSAPLRNPGFSYASGAFAKGGGAPTGLPGTFSDPWWLPGSPATGPSSLRWPVPGPWSLVPFSSSVISHPSRAGLRLETRTTSSAIPIPTQCPVPHHWQHKLKVWGIAERLDSGPRPSATKAQRTQPARYTSSAKPVTATLPSPASVAADPVLVCPSPFPVRPQSLARWPHPQDPAQAWEPGSRAMKAISIPADEAFLSYACRPRFKSIAGIRQGLFTPARLTDAVLQRYHSKRQAKRICTPRQAR